MDIDLTSRAHSEIESIVASYIDVNFYDEYFESNEDIREFKDMQCPSELVDEAYEAVAQVALDMDQMIDDDYVYEMIDDAWEQHRDEKLDYILDNYGCCSMCYDEDEDYMN